MPQRPHPVRGHPGRWSRVFYFRYRFGSAQLGFGQTPEDAVMETLDPETPCLLIGEELAGWLSEDEFTQAFTELVEKRAERMST